MKKWVILSIFVLSMSEILAKSNSLNGFYSTWFCRQWIEIKDDTAFITYSPTDTMAKCVFSRVDESFLEINTKTPEERLAEGLIITKDTSAIVPEDSIRISIHMPYKDSVKVNIGGSFRFNNFYIANGYHSLCIPTYHFNYDISLYFYPLSNKYEPFLSDFIDYYHSPRKGYRLSYKIMSTDRAIDFNLTNVNRTFFNAMTGIYGEYIRIKDDNTLIWRGIEYKKQKSLRPWHVEPHVI